MAQQTINIGASPNDGTGTPLRTAFQYTNSNFSELYTAVGPSGNNIVVPGSATISGDLTVDTSTLKVDSANNRVGIGTAAPISLAQFSGATPTIALSDTNPSSGSFFNLLFRHTDGLSATYNIATIQGQTNGNGGNGNLIFFTAASNSNTERYKIDSNGVATWSNVGGVAGTAMTLNANGLGIGVAPSAWNSTFKALQMGLGGSAYSQTGFNSVYLASNTFVDSGGNTKYINTDKATYYRQYDGIHSWFNAVSGTAGNAFTATQAMTLDASGNLLVGKTTLGDSNVGCQFMPTAGLSVSLTSQINTQTTLAVYSTGASAYRFYVGMGGTVYATNTTISAISDQRLKENVQDIDVGLGAILALKPRKFDWKEGKGKNIKGDRGFIAQEFEQVFPQLVDEWKDEAPEGEAPYKSVRQDLIPVLVKAIQELTARVQTLETR